MENSKKFLKELSDLSNKYGIEIIPWDGMYLWESHEPDKCIEYRISSNEEEVETYIYYK